MNTRLSKLVDEKINECYKIVNARYPERYFKKPEYDFSIKGRVAGRAYLNLNKMKFNEHLLVNNEKDFINQTIPHEIAHLIAYQLFGDTGHGKYWKFVMSSIFKLEPDRCHSFENVEPARKVKKFTYVCACSSHQVSKLIHEKILHGSNYTCKKCKRSLVSEKVKKALANI